MPKLKFSGYEQSCCAGNHSSSRSPALPVNRAANSPAQPRPHCVRHLTDATAEGSIPSHTYLSGSLGYQRSAIQIIVPVDVLRGDGAVRRAVVVRG